MAGGGAGLWPEPLCNAVSKRASARRWLLGLALCALKPCGAGGGAELLERLRPERLQSRRQNLRPELVAMRC